MQDTRKGGWTEDELQKMKAIHDNLGNDRCVAACCSVLQRVAACCSVLQRVVVCCSVLQYDATEDELQKMKIIHDNLGNDRCVTVCCSVLQRVAVCHNVLQCVATEDELKNIKAIYDKLERDSFVQKSPRSPQKSPLVSTKARGIYLPKRVLYLHKRIIYLGKRACGFCKGRLNVCGMADLYAWHDDNNSLICVP